MVEDNKDIFPDAAVVQAFPNAAPAIENSLTREAFDIYESRARRARDIYVKWGSRAVWLIALAAAFTVWEALLLEYTSDRVSKIAHALSIVFPLIAFFGICVHTILYIRKTKYRWILNRFAAERVRSIHFQSFSFAETATSTSDLATKVADYSRTSLAALEHELNVGFSVFRDLSPENVVSVGSIENARTAICMPDCVRAYSILRVEYQHKFALGEVERVERGSRVKHLFSDTAYLVGASSVLVTLILKLAFPLELLWIAIFEFAIVLLLLFGFLERFLEQISIKHETIARFKIYADAIKQIEAETDVTNLISRMEVVALSELKSFCDDVDQVMLRL